MRRFLLRLLLSLSSGFRLLRPIFTLILHLGGVFKTAQPVMLPPTVKWSGIIAKAQTRAPKYLSWRMTARSEWTYFLEALGRVVWFMTWRNHAGLVEMSPPLASIYTASATGIHHLHITTPPRLVGDRTSGFVQSLTDSPSQDNKAYLRFREGRCWKCQHCFYRAEQQTTQSLLFSWHIFCYFYSLSY